MTLSELTIRYDWESVDSSIRADELRATWARFELWIGEDCVTLSQDRQSKSAKRSITVSLYPAAEWIAFNWWLLNFNVRAESARGLPTTQTLRAAGDGFCWPDLAFLPVGDTTELRWRVREPEPTDPGRFVSSGHEWARTEQVLQQLSDLVDGVVEQLDASGIAETPLHEEWARVRSADRHEREFCEAAARLGLDPYSDGVDFADVIENLYAGFDTRLVNDFLDGATVGYLADDIKWMDRALGHLDAVEADQQSDAVSGFREPITRTFRDSSDFLPWTGGWRAAAAARKSLGLQPDARFPDDLLPVTSRQLSADDPALLGLGGVVGGSVSLVLARRLRARDKRFAHARGLFCGAASQQGSRFLLTSAPSADQRTARAFAAELLAPADGIAAMLSSLGNIATPEVITSIADHFDASPTIVQHQIDNQLAA